MLAVTRSGCVPWLNWASLQLLANPLGERQRVVQRGLVQQECERVAAKSGDHVPAARQLLDHAGRLSQDHVAALMTVLAVDERERVEIDENERCQRRAAGLRGSPLQLGLQRPAIRQRREQVGVRQNGLHLRRFRPAPQSAARSPAIRFCTSSVASRICVTALATPAAVWSEQLSRLAANLLQPLPVPLDLAGQLGRQHFQRRKHLAIRLLLPIERGEREQQSVRIRQAIANLLPLVVQRLANVVALMLHESVRLDDRFGHFRDDDRLGGRRLIQLRLESCECTRCAARRTSARFRRPPADFAGSAPPPAFAAASRCLAGLLCGRPRNHQPAAPPTNAANNGRTKLNQQRMTTYESPPATAGAMRRDLIEDERQPCAPARPGAGANQTIAYFRPAGRDAKKARFSAVIRRPPINPARPPIRVWLPPERPLPFPAPSDTSDPAPASGS